MGVWIDTDMGFDDIAAILVVVQSEFEIDGVSLVFGNTPLPQVRMNAAGAASAFGWKFPIHTGRAMPVLGKLETAQAILGETGIPTSGKSLPQAAALAESDAFAALCRWLERKGQHRILALGPLTNIAAVALARPDLAATHPGEFGDTGCEVRACQCEGGEIGQRAESQDPVRAIGL